MNFCRRIFCLSLVLATLLVSSALAGEAGELAQENGALENTQVALLFLSGLFFVAQSFLSARSIRHIFWIGAWFCLSCIVRELDVEDLAVPRWVILIGSGMGRNLIMAAGWGVLGVFAIKSYPELKGLLGRIARSRTVIFMFSAGTILLLGSLFDRGLISSVHGMFWEEIFETIGYFLLLLAAIFSSMILEEKALPLGA